jgi:transmembrane sensor
MEMDRSRVLIAAEAAEWFVRLHEGGHGVPEAFAEWLTRSPMHVEEYVAVSCAWAAVDIPEEGAFGTAALIEAARHQPDSANVVQLSDFNRPSAADRRTTHRQGFSGRYWAAAAAVVVLCAGAWLGFVGWRGEVYSTVVGEQRSVSLADGSVIFLNTDSEVHVRWTKARRHIDLVRGEARFQVAKNSARPFIVATAEAAVRAVGTVFNVRIDGERTQVAVLEGRVLVSALAKESDSARLRATTQNTALDSGAAVLLPSIELGAGERAAVTQHGIKPNAGESLEGVAAWTQRRLVFRAKSLADVVAEFNRYRTQPLFVDDPQLAALQISGSFDPGDAESLIGYLRDFETVEIKQAADGSVHLARAANESAGAR